MAWKDKSELDTPTPLNEPIETPDQNRIIQPEEYGWSYYSYDEDRGEAYKSIILDKNGNNTEIWFVGDHDGELPNRYPSGWNANIEYNDGILIFPNVMVEELNNNQVPNNWNIALDIIKRENKGKPVQVETPPYPPGTPGTPGSIASTVYDPNTPPYPPGTPGSVASPVYDPNTPPYPPSTPGSPESSVYNPNTPPYPPGSPGSVASPVYGPHTPPYPPPSHSGTPTSVAYHIYNPMTPPLPQNSPAYPLTDTPTNSIDSNPSPPPPPSDENNGSNETETHRKRDDGIELIINTDTTINKVDTDKNDENNGETNTSDEKKSISIN